MPVSKSVHPLQSGRCSEGVGLINFRLVEGGKGGGGAFDTGFGQSTIKKTNFKCKIGKTRLKLDRTILMFPFFSE